MSEEKVMCPKCGSSFNRMFLMGKQGNADVCPICGEFLLGDESNSAETVKEKTKWYYYKEGGGMLTDIVSSRFTPLYTFDAVDADDAERQLKEVMPNSPLFADNSSNKVRCPYCQSEEVQFVPKRFSLLTGFATNKFDRVCLRCKRKF